MNYTGRWCESSDSFQNCNGLYSIHILLVIPEAVTYYIEYKQTYYMYIEEAVLRKF